MSSGFGIKGGLGRCYPFFAEFKECLVSFGIIWNGALQYETLNSINGSQKTETSRTGKNCLGQRDDYFECLHHKKEHDMVRKVNEQVKINERLAKEGVAS